MIYHNGSFYENLYVLTTTLFLGSSQILYFCVCFYNKTGSENRNWFMKENIFIGIVFVATSYIIPFQWCNHVRWLILGYERFTLDVFEGLFEIRVFLKIYFTLYQCLWHIFQHLAWRRLLLIGWRYQDKRPQLVQMSSSFKRVFS